MTANISIILVVIGLAVVAYKMDQALYERQRLEDNLDADGDS